MITIHDYKTLVREVLGRDLEANLAQRDGVSHQDDDILMIVAGPGSGKTSVLVLRALRHVLVDDILPEHLFITTFTRKAAKELRTRWLDWGTLLLSTLRNNRNLRDAINRIDLNRCRIDTLDSLAQQALTENKMPGEVAPIVAEGSASKLLLKRTSFSTIYDANKDVLDHLFTRYTFEGKPPWNRGEALAVAKMLCERLIQDRVNLESFGQMSPAYQKVVDILEGYRNYLQSTNLFDFAVLELRFLERLQDESLKEWVNGIKALLIDEYQDTNPLQEAIYFNIISTSSPFVTVVGDDDQSMYRFRGGSVELFTQFANRCAAVTGKRTKRIDMVANYRSSGEIVNFYNSHIRGDAGFIPTRISPAKPEVVSERGVLGTPILGMFRENTVELAESLASWLQQLLANRRILLNNNGERFELCLSHEGALGDFVLLAHSIEEAKYNRFNGNAEQRFAGHFRSAMINRGLQIFNPRGRSLRTISSVQQLLGLLLLCLDPEHTRTGAAYPTNEAKFFLSEWRAAATTLINQNPTPSDNGGLGRFVAQWQEVALGVPNGNFPEDWPALELIFKLITWIPGFQNDPEHQVWLEAITRTVSSAGMASPYGMQIFKSGVHRDRSRESFIRDALLPIAENEVDVDEDIMPSVPRNRLQLMTIHQAKGLEFPLVIVDVGSHFTGNWAKQRFLRFPEEPSNIVKMEDDIEPHLGTPLRSYRSPIDRTFDDLTRLYYVAYSRPQSVLMLIGCESCLAYGRGKAQDKGIIPSIALGWARDRTWPWRQPFRGRRPPVRVEPPMLLI
ncbi:MAG: ATP-dependent helicase [Alphaproteobacteria bacterium]|uniref:DNA 3'-5' helicase n=1 Tax=Candidatus Nitrobium versatile TaxID=2884831 RepID=A0A953M3F3_9BACT|nr:ATP-dependent helicase [Candidatus Nitrobium versatile]